jgi:hypothetical protein
MKLHSIYRLAGGQTTSSLTLLQRQMPRCLQIIGNSPSAEDVAAETRGWLMFQSTYFHWRWPFHNRGHNRMEAGRITLLHTLNMDSFCVRGSGRKYWAYSAQTAGWSEHCIAHIWFENSTQTLGRLSSTLMYRQSLTTIVVPDTLIR